MREMTYHDDMISMAAIATKNLPEDKKEEFWELYHRATSEIYLVGAKADLFDSIKDNPLVKLAIWWVRGF